MAEVITIGVELTNFLCSQFLYRFEDTFFYMRVPDVTDKQVAWLVQTSGFVAKELKTRQKIKEYQFLLSIRDKNAKNIDAKLCEIETVLNRITCLELPHYKIYSLKVSNLGSQEDADAEGRYKGTLQLAVQVYDDYSNHSVY